MTYILGLGNEQKIREWGSVELAGFQQLINQLYIQSFLSVPMFIYSGN